MIANKIKTLIFPLLNLLVALALSSLNPTLKTIGEAISALDMTFLLGALVSGIIPLVMIIVFKLDTSEYFFGQLFFTGVSMISCMASFTYYEGYFPVAVPIILLIICLVFRLFFFRDRRKNIV